MCVCDRGRTYLRRSTSVPSELYPTAKQLLVLMHDTPSNSMPVELALRTIAQLVPSRRSTSVLISVSWAPKMWPKFPTAKQLVVLVHDTSTFAETSAANLADFSRTTATIAHLPERERATQ